MRMAKYLVLNLHQAVAANYQHPRHKQWVLPHRKCSQSWTAPSERCISARKRAQMYAPSQTGLAQTRRVRFSATRRPCTPRVCFRQRDMARHAIYHGARGADTPALANLVRPPELTRCTHNLAVEPQALSVRRPRQDCRCPAGPYVATLTAQRRTAKRLPLLRSRSTADVLRSRSSADDTRSTYRKRERTYCSRARGAASRWLPVVVCRANSPCVVARVQRTVRRRRRAR